MNDDQDLSKRSTSWPAILISGVVVVSLCFGGISAYSGRWKHANIDYVATKNRAGFIDSKDLFNLYKDMVSNGDPRSSQVISNDYLLDLLSGLIDSQILKDYAFKHGFTISDASLNKYIKNIYLFKDNKGKFSFKKYKDALNRYHIKVEEFENYLRLELSKKQLDDSFRSIGMMSDKVIDLLAKYHSQIRYLKEKKYLLSEFKSKVHLSDEEIKHHYDTHKQSYIIPKAIKFIYILLNKQIYIDKATPTLQEEQDYYKKHIKSYHEPESRSISEIFIRYPVAKDYSKEYQEKTRIKAEKIYQELLKAGYKEFANFAKKYSDDKSSSSTGGSMGDFYSNSQLFPEFGVPVFKLKLKDISKPIKTSIGYYIATVDSIKAPNTKTFDAVKNDISYLLKDLQGDAAFKIAVNKLIEVAPKHSSNLEDLAKEFNIGLGTENTWRMIDLGNAYYKISYPNLGKILFSDKYIDGKSNIPPFKLSNNSWVVARVTDYRNKAYKSLDDVSESIKNDLLEAKALKAAKNAAIADLAKLNKYKNDDWIHWPETRISVSKMHPLEQSFNSDNIDIIYSRPVKDIPYIAGMFTPSGGEPGCSIYKVVDYKNPLAPLKEDDAAMKAFSKSLQIYYGETVGLLFKTILRLYDNISIDNNAIDRIVANNYHKSAISKLVKK